jgi:hypothetical protein
MGYHSSTEPLSLGNMTVNNVVRDVLRQYNTPVTYLGSGVLVCCWIHMPSSSFNMFD